MKKHFQSIALIRTMTNDGKSRWLVKWHRELGYWRVLRADRLESESFREVILREVAWELELDRAREFCVSRMPRLCMEYVGKLPDEIEDKHIAVAFFLVPIYRENVIESLTRDGLMWVSSAEFCAGRTEAGEEIDPLCIYWVNRWEVVQPWN